MKMALAINQVFTRKGATKKARIAYMRRLQNALTLMRTETYHSIHTCSIWRWWQIRETNDLTHLLKQGTIESLLFYKTPFRKMMGWFPTKLPMNEKLKALKMIYTLMQDEYIKIVGWTDEQIKIFELQNEILEHNRAILSGDNTAWTWLDIAEQELKSMTSIDSGKANLLTMAAALEKVCKISIDIDKCSVAKWYSYIKMAETKEDVAE